jgi:pSer/pThr/pTyr-binding forkhead associated (FHA) protein
MPPRLRITGGPDKGKMFLLPPTSALNIGQLAERNQICLHDAKVSPVHCEVHSAAGGAIVRDLNSQTGVYVNGERVRQSELYHGSVIKVGDTEFTFESIDISMPGQPPPVVSEQPASDSIDPAEIMDPPRAHEPVERLAPSSLEDLQSLANSQFGRFELGSVIATGHSGVVFRARLPHEGRDLAIKILHPLFPEGNEEAASFTKIIKAYLPLRHPNLATVFGVGRSSSYAWIAMEFVEGDTLGRMLQHYADASPPEWTEAFRLAVHLARALNFARRHHFFHHNVSPANVLYRGADHLYKLADVPLYSALAGSKLGETTQSPKSRIQIAYMSPEQLQPQAHPDIRSDLYSVGALTYHMLMGKPPFTGRSRTETISLIRQAKPAAPRQVRSSIPALFEATVLNLLAKHPEDRFQEPAELLYELAKIAPDTD